MNRLDDLKEYEESERIAARIEAASSLNKLRTMHDALNEAEARAWLWNFHDPRSYVIYWKPFNLNYRKHG